MALSPNYGFPEPDNSSLVKNGAQDIRALGDAIDTAIWNVGFGQAGKNRIINGDFGIWQRGTSFTNPASSTYTADRYVVQLNNSCSYTISRQTFTPGAAPVAGYEGSFFLRYDRTTAGTTTFIALSQRIEDVRTFAGQTATLSFWAKASSAVSMTTELGQNFGSGGSSFVGVSSTSHSITTSWQRFIVTVAIPSISGKTVGTNSWFGLDFYPPQTTTAQIDIWGVQLEYGSKATPFETATGTIQGELAACQRYYWRTTSAISSYQQFSLQQGAANTTSVFNAITMPVTMRIKPSSIDYANISTNDGAFQAVTALTIDGGNENLVTLKAVVASGLTAGKLTQLQANATFNAFIGLSAEL